MTIYPGGPQDGVKYTMTAPDGSIATFNDSADSNFVGYAHFTGLDSAEIREAIDPRAGSDGMVQGHNYRGGRPVVGTVEIVATSTTDRNTKFQKLRRAANALSADGTLDFTPDGGIASRIYFRLNGPIRRADERGWKYTVQFPLMSADPYVVSQTLRTSTVSASPWQATVTNQGDGPASPVIRVTVTADGSVSLANQTAGATLNSNFIDKDLYYNFDFKWGSSGSGNGQFAAPNGIAIDSGGNVYVVDRNNHRVQKFNASGTYQAQVGSFGTGNGQFNHPHGIAIDASDNVFVVDTSNHRVQKFNSSLTYQSQFGSLGSGNGQFNSPTRCDHDGSGNLFVCDNGNKRVQKFDTAGAYVSQFGSSGTGNGQFSTVIDITINTATGDMWVLDGGDLFGGTTRVQKFNSSGTYQSQFGSLGVEDGQFFWPGALVRDTTGDLLVADTIGRRVQRFSSTGTFETKFSFVDTSGQAFGPSGLAVNASNVLYGTGDASVHRYTPGILTLTFDFDSRSITGAGQNLYKVLDVVNSDWWTLAPGDSVIQVTGGSTWTIDWRDTWL